MYLSLLFYVINVSLNTFLSILNNFNLNSKLISKFLITLLVFLIGYFVLQLGVGGGDYNLEKIYEESYERILFYSQFAFNLIILPFAETGIMMINKLGGYYLYLFTFFALVCSIIISLIKFQIKNLRIFLITYSFILLFLFKEPHTIFSPSPSSLVLFMILSYFMSTLHYSIKGLNFINKIMNSKISIIQCVSDLNLSSGGPSKTVTALSSNLLKLNIKVRICSQINEENKNVSELKKLNKNISFLNFSNKKDLLLIL